MTGAGASALARRDRIWPAVIASLAVHLAVAALALLNHGGPALEPPQRPLVARLVRLGEPRPRSYLPVKESPPEPAPAAPPAPAAAPATGPRAAPVVHAAPAAPAHPAPAGGRGGAGTDRLSGVLSRMRHELAAGSPDGDAAGDAADAAEGDRYLALVVRQLRQSYRLPATLSDRERLYLQGTVVLHVDGDGRILRHEFEKRSGNPAFDDALERALDEARLPPPPPALRDLYLRTGLEVVFKI